MVSYSSPPIILLPTISDRSLTRSIVSIRQITAMSKGMTWKERVQSFADTIRMETKNFFTFHPKDWLNAFRPNSKFPLFVLGDIDGFVALFMNNLATLLAVILGLKTVFSDQLIYGKIVPG
jgi:hypothetical protein